MEDFRTKELIIEDNNIRRNEEMMREYSDRQFEFSDNDSQYYDPYYGDLREDPMGCY